MRCGSSGRVGAEVWGAPGQRCRAPATGSSPQAPNPAVTELPQHCRSQPAWLSSRQHPRGPSGDARTRIPGSSPSLSPWQRVPWPAGHPLPPSVGAHGLGGGGSAGPLPTDTEHPGESCWPGGRARARSLAWVWPSSHIAAPQHPAPLALPLTQGLPVGAGGAQPWGSGAAEAQCRRGQPGWQGRTQQRGCTGGSARLGPGSAQPRDPAICGAHGSSPRLWHR